MKILFLFYAFAALAAGAYAQVVAVAPFEARAGISAGDAEVIAEVYSIRLSAARAVRVVTREALDRVVREHQFQEGDWSDNNKTAALGGALNADWIVRGTLQKLGNRMIITVTLLDIKTLEVKAGADMRINDVDDAYDRMDELVAQTVAAITGGPAVQTPAQAPVRAVPAGFVRVEGGTFWMGSVSSGDNDERPFHTVTVTGFYMGKYEVTQREWAEIMGGNPSGFRGDTLPVENVSWHDVIEYCNKRSLHEGLTPAYRGSGGSVTCDLSASGYRLPTEAEWEYAAKGGANGAYLTYLYAGSNSVDGIGWYTDNSSRRTHPVGTKQPNDLGLYDMSGNVWEWCWDWYGPYSGGSQTDPVGPASGSNRVLRGGCWNNSAPSLRSANRVSDTPAGRGDGDGGFRLVRP